MSSFQNASSFLLSVNSSGRDEAGRSVTRWNPFSSRTGRATDVPHCVMHNCATSTPGRSPALRTCTVTRMFPESEFSAASLAYFALMVGALYAKRV
jgi:hypothetical protein